MAMQVGLKIWRYDSKTGDRALKEYEIDAPEEATLLDCLDIVKDKHDGSLAYRKSCRMMICGSCGMRMDGGAVLACKVRMYDIAQEGHVPVISAMGNLPIVKDLVVDMDPFWQKMRSVDPYLQPRYDQAQERENVVPQAQMERDPQGVALHQLRLLRLGVQLDGVRSRLPRAGGARQGHALRRRPARRRHDRAAREVLRAPRALGLHALLLLQRALPEGRRSARRDREARRRGDEERDRPRHGREARQMVRHLGEDDRLAARDGARAEDAGHRLVDQGDEVRDGPRHEGQGAAAVPAACGGRGAGVAGAVRPRQDAGPRRRGRHRAGREGARADRVAPHRGEGRDPYSEADSAPRPFLPEPEREEAEGVPP